MRSRKVWQVIGIPVVAALLLRGSFDVVDWSSLWKLMTLTFFISLPYLVGVLTIYLSDINDVRSLPYRIFYPWLPIFVFLLLTLIFSIEGWACWLMILPIFMFFSSLGGLTAGFFKLRKARRAGNLNLSLAVLLPFLIAPIENAIRIIPGFYEANTFIDIEAPKARIWSNVTRVTEIDETEDQGILANVLNLPRPIRAELDFEGVGAKREAIFDKGLVFDETVLKYAHEEMMQFAIKAKTYDIPSTTFDKHVLIGGEFFDVLMGTYELEQIGDNKYRLHLFSRFKLSTTFNFYASIWGRWIMSDIQRNILVVIKKRSEGKA